MKGRRFLVFYFIFGLIFLLFFSFCAAFKNFMDVFSILKYEENLQNLDFFDGKMVLDEKKKLDFLSNTNGVFATIESEELGIFAPVYDEDFLNENERLFFLKDNNFFGSLKNGGCSILFAKDFLASENLFSDLINLETDDCLKVNILGKFKNFRIREINFVDFKDVKNFKADDFLNILVELPNKKSSNKFLIRAEEENCLEEELKIDFFHIIFKKRYIFILFCIFFLLFFLCCFVIFKKLILFFRSRHNVIKKKYIAKRIKYFNQFVD